MLTLFCPAYASGEQAGPSNDLNNDPPVVIHWKNYSVLSQADQARLGAIQLTIYRRHTITDADLSFVLTKLKSQPVTNKGLNKLELLCMVLVSLTGRKDFTKPQISRILQAITPFTSHHNSTVAGYATITLVGLRDARVIPVLEEIARSTKSPRVRQYALEHLPRLKQLAAAGEI